MQEANNWHGLSPKTAKDHGARTGIVAHLPPDATPKLFLIPMPSPEHPTPSPGPPLEQQGDSFFDIVRQLGETGGTDIFESIQHEVEAGNCSCEVRNPSGKCCLGEVRETIRHLETELGVKA